ncbi:radical SAM family heme chaperone HemW [Flavobacterium sp. xlx-214]|uniref:radical SAM family heme chaperone HemW n=1 Tax=unclassified Flavobacterium TaxID=196869 RepID=UPI0013D32F91|nr:MULTISPECIES: radical SAM family heme chaperone HemW [unclassified Flavobacterium]MBA5792889.1 radical SAM family heme chaperone HemW [Flavobacterium sp. xlx-221]QMI84777.1 radical SAM family heme chaperone HemW [Flavobacterium sp. xlx-214]
MAGIYIHIPFCKQACYYCDFHFSTSMKKKDEMIDALIQEIHLRKDEITEPVETIYFGGGTPSVLSNKEIDQILESVFSLFDVVEYPEITLEANPDDLQIERIHQLAESKINRLSIGVQSFYDEDLQMMNRAHNADEAWNSLVEATKYFDNISIDLIYGIPNLSMNRWKANVQKALNLGINHISTYALTVEPKTALAKLVKMGKIPNPNDGEAHEHFLALVEMLENAGFVHYELSNFGKPNYFSKNNSAYWLGKKYVGIGPSAHSFNGTHRSWNIANNALYIQAIQKGTLPNEVEKLTVQDRYNEYVMTGLRTIWGVSLKRIETEFGTHYKDYLVKEASAFITKQQLVLENDVLKTTINGKFFCDGIASELFWVD